MTGGGRATGGGRMTGGGRGTGGVSSSLQGRHAAAGSCRLRAARRLSFAPDLLLRLSEGKQTRQQKMQSDGN